MNPSLEYKPFFAEVVSCKRWKKQAQQRENKVNKKEDLSTHLKRVRIA